MKPQLNHTIVAAHDNRESAEFLAEFLGLEPPVAWGCLLYTSDAADE